MRYISTRGQAPPVSFLDAVLNGMAPDGGLYVPERWPTLEDVPTDPPWAFQFIATDTYAGTAALVLKAFAGDSLTEDEADDLCGSAYGPKALRWHRAVTPLTQIHSGAWILELFHGPSLSFKDVAMQLIGPLYDLALTRRDQRLTVVCATSGDTGGAAVEALGSRNRVDLFVLTPKGRVSDVQRRFMTTSGAGNIFAIEMDGDFDACQSLVKALFADVEFSQRAHLSAVNSINWARIVAQSVYYVIAASVLAAGGAVNFVVPSGNFGNAFSGYVAKRFGAAIGRIGIATNANDILARTVRSGRYERDAQSHSTLSPAMDIQIASNFERVLFEAVDRDAGVVRSLYQQFTRSQGFDVPPKAQLALREVFAAHATNDTLTSATMSAMKADYLLCPHTAVGVSASQHFRFEPGPVVTLATAHPAKFPDTVERATGIRPHLPPKCADLFERAEKFDTLPADVEAVKRYIRERSRAWR